jgi:Kelch motif
VYAIGGSNGTSIKKTVEAYRPATNTWATLPSMSTARYHLAAATAPCPRALDRTCVYAIGGDNRADLDTVEAYSPATNSWATVASMPTARSGLAAATAPCPGVRHRTCVYAIGGVSGSDALSTVEEYSPATNSWATLPSMPTARYGLAGAAAPCTAARHRTCVYAIDGVSGGTVLNTVEAFEVGR